MVKIRCFVKLTGFPVERTIGRQGVDPFSAKAESGIEDRTSTQAVPFTIHKLGRKVNHMEEDKDMSYEEETTEKIKVWVQENLRVITSVFIVAVIAFGIYSYSDRTPTSDDASLKKIASSEITKDGLKSDAVTSEEAAKATASTEEKAATDTQVQPTETSQETEGSFIEVASRGEGLTNLARKATTNYLEKNADSSLTFEHRIYIEDYLRKNVANQSGVKIGTNVEFSKDLIKKAIDASKTLNDSQLQNLKKYSARVSEFRK